MLLAMLCSTRASCATSVVGCSQVSTVAIWAYTIFLCIRLISFKCWLMIQDWMILKYRSLFQLIDSSRKISFSLVLSFVFTTIGQFPVTHSHIVKRQTLKNRSLRYQGLHGPPICCCLKNWKLYLFCAFLL